MDTEAHVAGRVRPLGQNDFYKKLDALEPGWILCGDSSLPDLPLTGPHLTVGRWRERVDVWLDDSGRPSQASRIHAHLEFSGSTGRWTLRDNASANGSFVNHTRVEGAVELQHGDRLGFGSCAMAEKTEGNLRHFHYTMSYPGSAPSAPYSVTSKVPSMVPSQPMPPPSAADPSPAATALAEAAPPAVVVTVGAPPPAAAPPPSLPAEASAGEVAAASTVPGEESGAMVGSNASQAAAVELGEKDTLLSLIGCLRSQLSQGEDSGQGEG